jgi:hypothetical protein
MPGQREDLVGLFDHVWDRFWRRMDGLDDEEWRWAPTADPRISLRWRLGHIRRLLSEERNGAWFGRPAEPTGLASRKAAGAAGRSFVLHIADELIHHTAEAALLRDLFADDSVRS